MLGPTRVLSPPVNIAGEIRKQNPHFKPFVTARFPAEMLAEIKRMEKRIGAFND